MPLCAASSIMATKHESPGMLSWTAHPLAPNRIIHSSNSPATVLKVADARKAAACGRNG
jgi:hypothetical protein